MADILSPLVGQSIHHIKNSAEFAILIRDLEVPPGNRIVSYDVTALFTSIPVQEAITTVKERLERDTSIQDRTPHSTTQISELLEFCLGTTYFVFGGQIFKQKHGTAMGSPVSPLVANIFMEEFKQKALATAPIPPSAWYRYVDYMVVVIRDDEID